MNRILVSMTLTAGLLLAGCAHNVDPAKANQCEALLKRASDALEEAKVKRIGGAARWTHAAALITSAATQQQFERFDSCIDKANRALALIQEAQAEKKQ